MRNVELWWFFDSSRTLESHSQGTIAMVTRNCQFRKKFISSVFFFPVWTIAHFRADNWFRHARRCSLQRSSVINILLCQKRKKQSQESISLLYPVWLKGRYFISHPQSSLLFLVIHKLIPGTETIICLLKSWAWKIKCRCTPESWKWPSLFELKVFRLVEILKKSSKEKEGLL